MDRNDYRQCIKNTPFIEKEIYIDFALDCVERVCDRTNVDIYNNPSNTIDDIADNIRDEVVSELLEHTDFNLWRESERCDCLMDEYLDKQSKKKTTAIYEILKIYLKSRMDKITS